MVALSRLLDLASVHTIYCSGCVGDAPLEKIHRIQDKGIGLLQPGRRLEISFLTILG